MGKSTRTLFPTSIGIGEMCLTGHIEVREGIFLGYKKQVNELF